MVELIGHTRTRTGLTVRVDLDTETCPTGIPIDDEAMDVLAIERDEFHGEWNYTIYPQTKQGDNDNVILSRVPSTGFGLSASAKAVIVVR